jgi:hypothetical protein
MEDNEAEQSYLGSAYDTAAYVADHALDNIENMVDTDHDGAVIDDVMGWGATGVAVVGGAVAGGVGGAVAGVLAGGGVASIPMSMAGAIGGIAAGSALGYAGDSVLGSIGEEGGDFISDVLGTRDELPYGDDGCTDLDYIDGRQGSPDPDGGFGHQLNEYFTE